MIFTVSTINTLSRCLHYFTKHFNHLAEMYELAKQVR